MTEAIGGDAQAVTAFIVSWQGSGAAERANFKLFLSELCDLWGIARVNVVKPDETENAHALDRYAKALHIARGTRMCCF